MNYPITDWIQTQAFGADPATYAQFGMLGHNGCDAAVAIGTPVRAPEDAVVTISGNNVQDPYTGNPVDGETVVLLGEYEHWLLHNSKRMVKAGQIVKQGDIVAYSGNTGFTTGPHCHWGTRPHNPDLNNGYRGFVDPIKVLKEATAMVNEGDVVNEYRALFGRDPSKDEIAKNVGKPWNDPDDKKRAPLYTDMLNQGIFLRQQLTDLSKSSCTPEERQLLDLLKKI